MKTTVQWLDEVKDCLGIASDYAAAKALHVTRASVSGWRTGRCTFDNEVCLRVAEILNANPFEVLATVNIERIKDEERRDLWANALERISVGFRQLALLANARQDWFLRV
ncbi:hypothetical protein [Paraburkholderia adhaesiva]|uniref:hypothetical protein n=1 Tax=Paraburkholderia adhaesiva TaxID=2883244 RepID=UPI001F425B4F|nr:hypothetical protein [Paraburkholderia adhaesiva]